MPLVQKLTPLFTRTNTETGEITTPDSKVYLILIFTNQEEQIFELANTRDEAFRICLRWASDINLAKSQVLTNNHTIEDSISVYSFIRICFIKETNAAMDSEITLDEITEWTAEAEDPSELWKKDGFEEET